MTLTNHFTSEEIALARAYNDFFRNVAGSRGANIEKLASSIANGYGISGRRLDSFRDVVGSTSRAVGLVKSLELRFGVDGNGSFINPEKVFHSIDGLTELVDYAANPSAVKSHNFAVCFEIDDWHDESAHGRAIYHDFPVIVVPSIASGVFEREVEKDERIVTPEIKLLRYSSNLDNAALARAKQIHVKMHELRHAYDDIMGRFGQGIPFQEFVAHVYAHPNPVVNPRYDKTLGLNEDCSVLEIRDDLKAIAAANPRSKFAANGLVRARFLEAAKKEVFAAYMDCPMEDRPVLSYLISMKYHSFPKAEGEGR